MNRKIKRVAAGVMLAGALGVVNQAQAAVIDHFDAPNQNLWANCGFCGPNHLSDNVASPGSIGGWRNVVLTPVTGLATVSIGPSSFDGHSFDLANNPGAKSTVTMLWDNNGAGLGGVDLTGNGLTPNFALGINSIDSTGVSITFNVKDVGNHIATKTISGVSIGTVLFALNTFSNFGNTSFTSVKSIEMIVSATKADADISLAFVQTIPEPSSLALMGLGLVGFSVLRKRKAA